MPRGDGTILDPNVHEAFIRNYAAQRGLDPDFIARLATAEGLNAWRTYGHCFSHSNVSPAPSNTSPLAGVLVSQMLPDLTLMHLIPDRRSSRITSSRFKKRVPL